MSIKIQKAIHLTLHLSSADKQTFVSPHLPLVYRGLPIEQMFNFSTAEVKTTGNYL